MPVYSRPMLLEEGAHLTIEDVGAFEVGRMAGGIHQLEARARHMLVDLLRQLGPDEPVFVAGQEQGWARVWRRSAPPAWSGARAGHGCPRTAARSGPRSAH